METKKIFVVLGMHRSGTSALVKALEVMGLSLGDELLPAGGGNEKGVWEDRRIVELNERVLKLAGLNWDSIVQFPDDLLDTSECKGLVDDAVRLVEQRLKMMPFWGFKDPRTARVLSFWQRVFSQLELDVSYIVAIRNPMDIALSLEKRDGLSSIKAQLLWLIHTLPNMPLLADKTFTFVSFDKLLDSPKECLQQAAEDLSLTLDKKRVENYCTSFLDKELRHASHSLNDLALSSEALPLTCRLYQQLLNIEQGRSTLSDVVEREYKDFVIDFHANLVEWQTHYIDQGVINERENESLNQHINSLNQQIKSTGDYAKHLETNLELHQHKVHEHAETIHRFSESFERLSLELVVQATTITDQATTITDQATTITDQATTITDQLSAINELRAKSELLLNSTSWRITSPLRKLVSVMGVSRYALLRNSENITAQNSHFFSRQLYRIRLANHLSKKYVSSKGGGYKGFKKLVFTLCSRLKTTGFSGVRAQARAYALRSATNYSPISVSIERPQKQNVPNLHRDTTETVDVIVCVHNAFEDVKRCLSSVLEYSMPPYRIIIVDDGSKEDTQQYLEHFSKAQGAILLRNNEAKGYTLAANQGMRRSQARYVTLLNSDTIVTSQWLERMVCCANSDSSIGLVGPLSNTASWQSIPQVMMDGDWADNTLPEDVSIADMGLLVAKYSGCAYPGISFLNGFCILIKREVLQQLGYFDEVTFAKGYGEENDYCIRARKAGWKLAIADDAYVYHAQSKSYSHDRRKELAELAGKALAQKHGQDVILAGVGQCQNSLVFKAIRAKTSGMFEREKLLENGSGQWEGKRIAILLPVIEVGGGAHVVLTEANALQKMGIQVDILNFEAHRAGFEANYPNLLFRVRYFSNPNSIADIEGQYDAVIATANTSVEWLVPLSQSTNCPILGYYIQDFEPGFYEHRSKGYDEALSSYSRIEGMKLFTKTKWNAEKLKEETGKNAAIIGACVDYDAFLPVEVECSAPVSIVAMIRPSTPRRAAEDTMRVLERISKEFGNKVTITLFGEDAGHRIFNQYEVQAKCLGAVSSQEVGVILSAADIFVDFSKFQAMGLTAMEAMASGAAVIVPEQGGATTFATNNENALVVDAHNIEECYNALHRLIVDSELRVKLQGASVESITRFSPEASAFKLAKVLFNDKP